MLSEIFLNSRNEAYLARVSIFVHLVTDTYIYLSIYSISFILFYFISFYSILFYLLSFIDDQNFFITFFFHLFCDNLPCSAMFRDVPECSGMFRDVAGCSGMFRVLLTPVTPYHCHLGNVPSLNGFPAVLKHFYGMGNVSCRNMNMTSSPRQVDLDCTVHICTLHLANVL